MAIPILLASNNPHKLEEFRQILGDTFDVLSPRDLGMVLDVEEAGTTFEENARLKAEALAGASDLVTIADDSGLLVDALGGEPGVRSARYGGPNKSDTDRLELVLERLRGVPAEARSARFVAAIAICGPELPTAVVEGEVEGFITESPRGRGGFGYDPIFLYPPAGRTFGEMPANDKALVSHRGIALRRGRVLLEGRYTGTDFSRMGSS